MSKKWNQSVIKVLALLLAVVMTVGLTACGGGSHQKYPLRLAMFGPVSEKNPGSIMRLHKGICYLSDDVAKPATTPPDYDILERIAEIKAKEEK